MPFFINKGGSQVWKNDKGQRHREDGPARIYPNGIKEYYQNDQLHREDGPATIYYGGYKEYFLKGKRYSENEYCKALKTLKQEGYYHAILY